MNRSILPAALAATLLLAACGERSSEPATPPSAERAPETTPARDIEREPPPLANTRAPDTSAMGAGPALGPPGSIDCGLRSFEAELMQRINAARAAGARCGARSMPSAPALRWDLSLQSAAGGHSLAMAKGNFFAHRGGDGSSVSQRVSAQRYDWKTVGENIAGGDTSAAEVIQSWLGSPEHCRNLMDPVYTDVAVACVREPSTQYGTYWTMVLGRKR